MRSFVSRAAAAAALALFTVAAALADEGLIHTGCDPRATFASGPLTVSAAFARAMPPRAPTAGGYLTVSNSGDSADMLTGATSEAAADITLHQMSMKGSMMVMAPVEGGIAVPANGSVALSPKGFHMMFASIGTPFKQGECVAVTLHFAKAGDLPVVLSIAGVAADAPPGQQMDMHGTAPAAK